MSNVAGVVLMLLAVLVFVMCLIGLISPKWLKYSKTGDAPKRSHIAWTLFLMPLLLLGVGGSLLDPVEKQDTPAAANTSTAPDSSAPAISAVADQVAKPARQTLGVQPEDFRKSYNALIGQVDKSWRVAEFDITQGSVNDTFTAKLGAAASMVGSVDKATQKLISVTVIAGGGQGQDNLQSIAVLMSTAHALTQGASKKEISDAVSTLVTAALDGMDQADTPMQSRTIGNRKLSATASNITGLMFFVSSAE